MVSKITEVTQVTVGKYYLVPHVTMRFGDSIGFGHGDRVPVMFPFHEDKLLGVPQIHYHYDTRFINKKILEKSIIFSTIIKEKISRFQARVIPLESVIGDIEWKRRLCLREHPITPTNLVILPILEPIYEDAIAVNRICPHRGISMVGCPVKDGIIACPAHGLRWEEKTGKLHKQLENHECLSIP